MDLVQEVRAEEAILRYRPPDIKVVRTPKRYGHLVEKGNVSCLVLFLFFFFWWYKVWRFCLADKCVNGCW